MSHAKHLLKIFGIIFLSILLTLGATLGVAFFRLHQNTSAMYDDESVILNDPEYQDDLQVEGVPLVTQEYSCGYAVIEMFSKWSGGTITEETMYSEYGKVVTDTGDSFVNEFNKRIPDYPVTKYSYLTESDLLRCLHDSLKNQIPVPIEWAAKYEDTWTLHYSLVTGMNLKENNISVANPYGYNENITVEEFLSRTTFDAFENMPFGFTMGFAFGLFEKNTIFLPNKA